MRNAKCTKCLLKWEMPRNAYLNEWMKDEKYKIKRVEKKKDKKNIYK